MMALRPVVVVVAAVMAFLARPRSRIYVHLLPALPPSLCPPLAAHIKERERRGGGVSA